MVNLAHMHRGLLTPGASYDHCVASFRWPELTRFNIAEAICHRHARTMPHAPALIVEDETNPVRVVSFLELSRHANRLANVLRHLGVCQGSRVAIHLPQCLETASAHIASYQLGAIALPLFSLFGPEALLHRLRDAEAKVLLTDRANLQRLAPVRDQLPALQHILCVDGDTAGAKSLATLLARASDQCAVAATAYDDPALLIYTSGTTGPPKGALHAHRVLIGHLPGVEMPHRFLPQDDDRMWTPADWAWAGGLLDVLLPSLYHAVTVIATKRARFDPQWAFELMARHHVRNVFMPPTALRILRQVNNPRRFNYRLRSAASGGESLGEDMLAWGEEVFGLTINEFYGQTEVNLVVGNNADVFPARPGSMGRAIPGHRVAVVNEHGHPLPPGHEGVVAVRRPDPVMFLNYWQRPQATAEKFKGDWCLLGDLALMDEDGYFWFKSRTDDVIISAGYRIGPSEVEECLMRHPSVQLAGVIGTPDSVRGEVVKAYVVLREGMPESDALQQELTQFVREHLSAHEYPRAIRFISEMPLTVTGKIQRVRLREMDACESARDHRPPK